MIEEYINLAKREPWRLQALCRGKGQFFFKQEEETTPYDEARIICAACPVKKECLDSALEKHERGGFWGGMSYRERCAEMRRRKRLTI